jgi:hypothetical protein
VGNSVELYRTSHDSLDRVKYHDNESTWPIRDRRGDIPPLLWIACFKKDDMNLETEIDDDDGRRFDYAHFFTSFDAAISNLSNRARHIQRIFRKNDGIDRCIEDLANQLSSKDGVSLYLPIRMFDWHREATAWTLDTLSILDSERLVGPDAAEVIAARHAFRVSEKKLFSTKWLPFFTPQQLDDSEHPKSDWDRTGGLIGWNEY